MIAIRPTVGRKVLYKPTASDHMATDASGFCAAIIAYVHDDSTVNLCVIGGNGHSTPRSNVKLVQPGEEVPASGYCCWMPFQIQTAKERARKEEVETTVAAAK